VLDIEGMNNVNDNKEGNDEGKGDEVKDGRENLV